MNIDNTFYIYKITNLVNKKIYIGQTNKNILTRWSQHKSAARNNKKYCYKLENAINKYGEDNFIIEIILKTNDEKFVNMAEIELIKTNNSIKCGYNIQEGGKGYRNIRGDKNPNSKLTRKQVSIIRHLAKNKLLSQKEMAIKFNVSRTTIQRVIHNNSWQSLRSKKINMQRKLTINNIKNIKKLLRNNCPVFKIAKKYNISKPMVWLIKRGGIYSDII